jgi:hypothetical protein
MCRNKVLKERSERKSWRRIRNMSCTQHMSLGCSDLGDKMVGKQRQYGPDQKCIEGIGKPEGKRTLGKSKHR